MNLIAIMALLIIVLYTLGFAITMWKEKQKAGALATLCLVCLIIVLPFFTIFKS